MPSREPSKMTDFEPAQFQYSRFSNRRRLESAERRTEILRLLRYAATIGLSTGIANVIVEIFNDEPWFESCLVILWTVPGSLVGAFIFLAMATVTHALGIYPVLGGVLFDLNPERKTSLFSHRLVTMCILAFGASIGSIASLPLVLKQRDDRHLVWLVAAAVFFSSAFVIAQDSIKVRRRRKVVSDLQSFENAEETEESIH